MRTIVSMAYRVSDLLGLGSARNRRGDVRGDLDAHVAEMLAGFSAASSSRRTFLRSRTMGRAEEASSMITRSDVRSLDRGRVLWAILLGPGGSFAGSPTWSFESIEFTGNSFVYQFRNRYLDRVLSGIRRLPVTIYRRYNDDIFDGVVCPGYEFR